MNDNTSNNMMVFPKFRTINEAIAEIKSLDPNTAITKNYLRQLVKKNIIPTTKVGTKVLINMKTLIEFLESNH